MGADGGFIYHDELYGRYALYVAVGRVVGDETVDSGVGCAVAMIVGALRGTEPTCECRGGTCC